MDDERPDVLTIGRLAHRTGLPVRTLRFWSDEGAVPPVGRSAGGYRLYDTESVARVELVRTLRELGLGLDDVCRVLSGRTTVAGVADAHVAALDAQIRSLKVSRAVLSTVAKRGSTVEETALMNRLARLSAAERKQIIDEFKEEVFGGLDDPRLRDRMRAFSIDLPDDPTPEQVDAWIELAELVRDPEFRARLRTWMELNTPVPGQGRPPGASIWWARQIVQTVAEVRKGGVAPEGPAAAEVLSELFGDADRAAVLRSLEAGIEAGAEHYRRLVARVRGQNSSPDATEELEWLARALRAADQT
ncbi:helix-turn-helix domain-containing protein [Streptomyces europaeiscabiei]|uniref:MerR family transcriptional regulator n=1 Tax=Streptomyces europaeiscabiei TaxID=146819 RepID=A0ABU4NTJ6_9ACTN|nr:MerR family transcriptional regulator [Streptomyces europaeiscabiei]MDX2524668.1 MerR family transcriptional regulator [Streptomyces europaeiscabiei]MDX2762501.1 MerR family transcriptional regulator [Streptomyces europaeiscabiei]MDX2769154.1 MerR family transcriptional regulator [Streptomyces europaeiscabiei]MDX3548510.1 MerR family transcriptional regulator [Streptomyces europaeiscabiei]MDX3558153.1 MerR family transcriptional regulator [Streptomyces europaeiscabiei]